MQKIFNSNSDRFEIQHWENFTLGKGGVKSEWEFLQSSIIAMRSFHGWHWWRYQTTEK